MSERVPPNGSDDPDDVLERALESALDPAIVALIANVDPPDPMRRERAIETALRAFDERSPRDVSDRDVSDRELSNRGPSARRVVRAGATRTLVGIAAAIVVIGAAGVVVVNVTDRATTDESAAVDREAAVEPLEIATTSDSISDPVVGAPSPPTVDEPDLDTSADVPVTTTTTRPSGSLGLPPIPAPPPLGPPLLGQPPLDQPPPDQPPLDDGDADTGGPPPPAVLARLNSPEELAAFARNALAAGQRGPVPPCAPAGATGLGDAIYDDALISVIALDALRVQGIDPESCAVAVSVTLD